MWKWNAGVPNIVCIGRAWPAIITTPWPPVATALGLSCHRTGTGLFVQWDRIILSEWLTSGINRQVAIVQPGLFDDWMPCHWTLFRVLKVVWHPDPEFHSRLFTFNPFGIIRSMLNIAGVLTHDDIHWLCRIMSSNQKLTNWKSETGHRLSTNEYRFANWLKSFLSLSKKQL